jgi:ubiquinone/menaquinone biosynthesis C-methylase UbiE
MAQLSAFERWWLDAWPHRLHIRHYVPKFLHACPEPFRGQVLEVGAGSGWTSRTILETFPQVELTATDVDPRVSSRFSHLQRHYGRRLQVQQADVQHLPFDRASFDMVVAFHMMHHVEDAAGAVRQFMRVLRPGGLLGIADTNELPREELVAALSGEAKVVVNEGDGYYYVWAQKAYPF